MKVLIADDDPVSRRLAEVTLIKAGFEVEAASEGESAAIALCADGGPRLALLDWMMPGLDGPAICREVRRRRDQPYVYIILLTSKAAKDDVITGLEAGADDFLSKPFHGEELKARLRSGQRILRLEDRLVEAREEMRFKATHDPLTSLWNRGVLVEFLQRELYRAQREDSSVAVLLCDLDQFKKINDTLGHPAGDEVLRETARRLLGSVRSYDVVGRYGGEEFLVLLPGCDAKSTLQRAEQVRRAVSFRPINTEQGPAFLTVSIGALASRDWHSTDTRILMREVDGALYAAKAAGRNCVVFAEPTGKRKVGRPSPLPEQSPVKS